MPELPSNLIADPLLPQYRWNTAANRYVSEDGRFVSKTTIRLELDKVTDNIGEQMKTLSRQFRAGDIDGLTFQTQGMNLIKQTNLAGAAMEKGGWFQMTQSDFGRSGQIIRQEYGFFRNMIKDIESGKQRLDGTLDVRMNQYAQNGRDTFHRFETIAMEDLGFDEERRILHGRDHCRTSKQRQGCVEQAAIGWRPIGTLIHIGGCVCLNNCRCDKIYRKSSEQ